MALTPDYLLARRPADPLKKDNGEVETLEDFARGVIALAIDGAIGTMPEQAPERFEIDAKLVIEKFSDGDTGEHCVTICVSTWSGMVCKHAAPPE